MCLNQIDHDIISNHISMKILVFLYHHHKKLNIYVQIKGVYLTKEKNA